MKMKYAKNTAHLKAGILAASFLSLGSITTANAADTFTEAFTGGSIYADLNLRYETVDQDNALEDADALTLRTRLGYKTDTFNGFSGLIEFEDSREVLGVDDFSVPPAGVRAGQFSVIADPETTELDQGFIQYSGGGFTAKVGRQVITLDNHRFVGHVGWRQDRQTYDAVSITYAPNDKFKLFGAQLSQRNRIFAEEANIQSEDTLINASFTTSFGKFVGYAYLLEVDNGTDNSLDTFGISFSGKSGNVTYAAEVASQEANDTIDSSYLKLEGGVTFGPVTAKLGYESLGSDDGQGAFTTPLATLHAFNGWTDQFLGTPAAGLNNLYVSASAKLGGGTLTGVFHDFTSDVDAMGFDDLGSEIDVVYVRPLSKNYVLGAKFGSYSAGDATFGKVDTDKLWLWFNAKF
ncbi:MAG: alginate export family protein [Acidiferrobacterales bacterium]|nr:alginate export family protein [Acidiferrobacterales bacterium]